MANLTSMSGPDLVTMAKSGDDKAGRVLLGRYNKRLAKCGADHRQTRLLARWLGEIVEARRAQPEVQDVQPEVQPEVQDVQPEVQAEGADAIVAAVLAKRAAAPAKRPVRRFSADTVAAYRLMDEHGLTAGEVAEYLGKTEGTVRNAVTRVRKALRDGDDIIWG